MVFVGQCAVQRDTKVDWMFAVGQHSAVHTDGQLALAVSIVQMECRGGGLGRAKYEAPFLQIVGYSLHVVVECLLNLLPGVIRSE